MDITPYFTDVATLAAFVTLCTAALRKLSWFSAWAGLKVQILSWVVAAALTVLGAVYDYGIFAGLGPISVSLFGLMAGLIANGAHDAVIRVFEYVATRVPDDR